MPTITYHASHAAIEVPRNAAIITEFNDTIPAFCRSWNAATSTWLIYPPGVMQARSIVLAHYPDTTEEIDLEHLGIHEAAERAYRAQEAERERERRQRYAGFYAGNFGWTPPDAPDPDYELLGVTPRSPRDVVEAAYRALARSHHPDVGGDAAVMTQLTSAIERIRKARGWR